MIGGLCRKPLIAPAGKTLDLARKFKFDQGDADRIGGQSATLGQAIDRRRILRCRCGIRGGWRLGDGGATRRNERLVDAVWRGAEARARER